jgi:hypothetical protein
VADQKLLSIYLNDHLAGSTVGVELARRSRASNEGPEYGALLESLTAEIEADRKSLLDLMERLDVGRDRAKEGAAWALEKAGRLKLNGRLTGYSPLSRLVELEGLWMGIEGKLSMWRALLAIAEDDERLDRLELEALATRAEEQLQRLGKHRGPVARDALAA